jgi:hypothetical protein
LKEEKIEENIPPAGENMAVAVAVAVEESMETEIEGGGDGPGAGGFSAARCVLFAWIK